MDGVPSHWQPLSQQKGADVCGCSCRCTLFGVRLFVCSASVCLSVMTDSTENATPPKSTESRNSKSVAQIHIKNKSQSEFVPRNTEEFEFVDMVDFGNVAFTMKKLS